MVINIITVALRIDSVFWRTSESVLNQDFGSREVRLRWILRVKYGIDNYILEFFENLVNIEVIISSEEDYGIFSAMNIGLNYCKEGFVLFLNSGDELIENVIGKVVDELILLDNSKVVACFSVLEINPDRGGLPALVKARTPYYLFYAMNAHHQGCFYSSSLFDDLRYDESLSIAADFKLHFTLYRNNVDFFISDLIVSRFYLGGVSTSKLTLLLVEDLKVKWTGMKNIEKILFFLPSAILRSFMILIRSKFTIIYDYIRKIVRT